MCKVDKIVSELSAAPRGDMHSQHVAAVYNGGTINATPFSGGATYRKPPCCQQPVATLHSVMPLWVTDTDLGQASSRNYSGGYYSPDNLHTMLAEAISRATISMTIPHAP